MQNISLLPAVLAFALSVAMGPVLIPVLKKLRVGQTVREDGPGTHLKKTEPRPWAALSLWEP